MKWFFVILAAVVLVTAVMVFGMCALWDFAGAELRPIAHQALSDCDAGKYRTVYDGASASLRSKTTFDAFVRTLTASKAALGAYIEIAKVTGVHVDADADTGKTADLRIRIRYEHAETGGTFRFVKEDGAWLLSGLEIEAPEPNKDHGEK